MNNDLISRSEMLKESGILTVHTREYGTIDVIPVGYLQDIRNADTERHGTWIYVDSDLGWRNEKCSVCGEIVTVYDEDDSYKYCRNCGARMDGDTE